MSLGLYPFAIKRLVVFYAWTIYYAWKPFDFIQHLLVVYLNIPEFDRYLKLQEEIGHVLFGTLATFERPLRKSTGISLEKELNDIEESDWSPVVYMDTIVHSIPALIFLHMAIVSQWPLSSSGLVFALVTIEICYGISRTDMTRRSSKNLERVIRKLSDNSLIASLPERENPLLRLETCAKGSKLLENFFAETESKLALPVAKLTRQTYLVVAFLLILQLAAQLARVFFGLELC